MQGVLNNVLLEHGGLPFIFPFKVHLDFGHLVAHKISVSAPVPLELILTGFDWVGAGPWGFGFWDGA